MEAGLRRRTALYWSGIERCLGTAEAADGVPAIIRGDEGCHGMDAAERNRGALGTDHLTQDLGARTALGGITAMAAQVTRIVVQLGVMAVMARLLAPKDFGLVAMATTLTAFVGMFTNLGLSEATVQRKDIDQATVSVLFYINLAMGAAVMLLCMAAAPVAAWLFGDPRVLLLVIALSLSIPVSAAGAQHNALLQRGMHWRQLQWTPILAQAVGGAAAIVLAWKTGIGYWALVVQLWTAAVVSTGLLWWFCPWRPGAITHWSRAGSALHFGLNLTGFNFVNYFHRQFDNVLIGWRWGAADLGYYTRAYTLLTLPLTLVSAPMASAVVPALSRLQDDPERWRRAFLKAFGALNLVSAGLTAMLIVSAEPLVRLVYGPGWSEAGHIFLLLAISMFASTPMNAAGWVYVSLGQTRRMFHWALLVTPFYVLAFLIGLPFGAAGVAFCYSVAMWLAAVPCLAFAVAGTPLRAGGLIRIAIFPILLGAIAAASGRLLLSQFESTSTLLKLFAAAGASGAAYGAGSLILLIWDSSLRSIRDDMVNRLHRLTGASRLFT